MGKETKIGMKIEEETKGIKKICEQLEESIKHEFNKGIEQVDTMEMKEVIDMFKDLYEAKKAIVEACYYTTILEAMEKAEEEGEEDGDDEGRMYYRGQPRSKTTGRFMRRGDGRRNNRGRRGFDEPLYYMTPEMYHMYDPEELRDMDREDGRMYYTGGTFGSQGGSRGATGGSGSMGNSGGSQGGGRSYYGGEGSDGGRDYREGKSGQSRRNYIETKEMHKGNTPADKQAKMKELENYTKELSEDVTEMISDATPEEKQMIKTKLQTLAQKIQ